MGKNVLVMMDTCSPETSGGVSLPESLVEQMTIAAESGIVVAVGSNAFRRHDDGTIWDGEKVEPGDRVNVIKYSGVEVVGVDGRFYRSMGYECIATKLDKDARIFTHLGEIGDSGAGA